MEHQLIRICDPTSSGQPTFNGQPSLCQQSSGGLTDFCQCTLNKISTFARDTPVGDPTSATLLQIDSSSDYTAFSRVVLKTMLDIRHCVRQLGTALEGLRAQQAKLPLRLSKNENAAVLPTAILPLFALKANVFGITWWKRLRRSDPHHARNPHEESSSVQLLCARPKQVKSAIQRHSTVRRFLR